MNCVTPHFRRADKFNNLKNNIYSVSYNFFLVFSSFSFYFLQLFPLRRHHHHTIDRHIHNSFAHLTFTHSRKAHCCSAAHQEWTHRKQLSYLILIDFTLWYICPFRPTDCSFYPVRV